jgi:hypothetical protein
MKTEKDLPSIYRELRKDVKEFLLDVLKDTDEEHPMKVYIPLEFGAMGLSTLEMPTITHLYKELDTIYAKYDGCDGYVEADGGLYLDDLIQIIGEI